MRQMRIAVLGLVVLMTVLWGCERKVTEEVTKIIAAEGIAEHVGSEACGACHAAKYESFMNTGHPYKLNEAEDVQAGDYYPYTDVPDAPSIVAWSDVDKVIGGFWWKARFIRHSGSIVTGAEVQYNLVDGSWSGYHDGEDLNYDCGPCHMTAYRDTGNQEGHDSLIGTWAFNGVQCEECHGAGSLHAATPYEFDMKIDRSNEGCGKCHIRGDVNKIPASGDFVRHHEQWNEMFTTKHVTLQCVDCHDVHYSLHPDSPDREMAIKLLCENCHLDDAETFGRTDIEEHLTSPFAPGCIDCHMPKGAKSAKAADTWVGDVTSHLWRINTDVNAEYITDGFANGYLTVEYTCLKCHTDKDKAWASSNAPRSHAAQIASTDECMVCHDGGSSNLAQKVIAATRQWEFSQHATGERSDRSSGSCAKCHTNEGFIAEVTGGEVAGDIFNAIGCFTCHDPHTNGSFALRTTDEVTLGNGAEFDNGLSNLCVNCHKGRRDVNTYVVAGTKLSSYYGSHYGNQSDMLLGENAYEYADYSYDNSWHTDGVADPCLSCHFDESDRYELGGHTFLMATEGGENVDACNVGGCHTGDFKIDSLNRIADVDFDGDATIEGVNDEIAGLITELETALLAAGLLSGDPGDTHPTANLVVPDVDSVGAVFNFKYVTADRSNGIHNTRYAVGLLQSSINYMTTGDPNGAPARKPLSVLTTH